MKISKKEFIQMIEYRKLINSVPLEELDLSEFTDKKITKEEIEEWNFTGLNNIDYIRNLL